jgi:hypothetical protein
VTVSNVFPEGVTNFGFACDNTNLTLVSTGVLANGSGYAVAKFMDSAVTLAVGGQITVTFTTQNSRTNIVLTDSVFVSANSTDPFKVNNYAAVKVLVARPYADLSITLVGGLSQASPGDWIMYSAIVSNQGPQTAMGVVLTYETNGVTNTVPVGDLDMGKTLTNLFQMQIRSSGCVLMNSVYVSAATLDPSKVDNMASHKVIVGNSPALSVVSYQNGYAFSWPSTNRAFVLESTPTMSATPVWTEVSNPSLIVTNGQTIVPLSITSNTPAAYFRLNLK